MKDQKIESYHMLQKIQHRSALVSKQVIINKSYKFNPLRYETTWKK